jgi:hypothetical protein
MESVVLDALGFRLNTPTAYSFLCLFDQGICLGPSTKALACYLVVRVQSSDMHALKKCMLWEWLLPRRYLAGLLPGYSMIWQPLIAGAGDSGLPFPDLCALRNWGGCTPTGRPARPRPERREAGGGGSKALYVVQLRCSQPPRGTCWDSRLLVA